MKKLLALLMALSLVVFTGCSGDKTKTKTGDGKTKTEEKPGDNKPGDNKPETKTVEGPITKIDGTDVWVKDEKYSLKEETITGKKTKVGDLAKGDTLKLTWKGKKLESVEVTDVAKEVPVVPKAVDGEVTDVKGKTVSVKVGERTVDFDAADEEAAKKFKKGDKVKITIDEKGKATKLEPGK
jgi:hypothetical protein